MNRVFHDQMGELAAQKHVQFILSVEKKKDSLEAVAMEHPRMNGEYWYLTTLDLLGKLQAVDVDEVVSWVLQCQHDSGGFGGNIGHDPYVQYTLSAVQVLVLFNKIDVLDADKVASYVATLQNEDGSFSGDGVEKAVNYTVSCKNHDGGFGCTPGGESHAGQNLVLMDIENGGISDRPDDVVDVYHTYFGVAVDVRLELLSFELHPEELLGTAYDWDKISNDYMR